MAFEKVKGYITSQPPTPKSPRSPQSPRVRSPSSPTLGRHVKKALPPTPPGHVPHANINPLLIPKFNPDQPQTQRSPPHSAGHSPRIPRSRDPTPTDTPKKRLSTNLVDPYPHDHTITPKNRGVFYPDEGAMFQKVAHERGEAGGNGGSPSLAKRKTEKLKALYKRNHSVYFTRFPYLTISRRHKTTNLQQVRRRLREKIKR